MSLQIKFKLLVRGVAVALAAGLTVSTATLGADPVVEAPAGAVRGDSRGGLTVFKGIPYAAPPIGDARWKAPADAPVWDGVKDATDFGPACLQPVRTTGSIYADDVGVMSEDCLNLNIWAPKDAEKAGVFVWIHGGALRSGASSLGMYDGARLAEKGMVVVSINYRLGVLGYLAHPELSAETDDNISGNYGLLDQIKALEWVRDNIAAFGGDPDNVTIAGESAGALSVMYLMASPPARGLFHKAVAQSAYMITTPELRENRFGQIPGEAVGAWLMGKLGAANLGDLRAMDADVLTIEAPKTGYAPFGVIDGKILPRQLVEVFDRGEQAPVPIIAGFNSGEIRSLRFLMPPKPESAEAYEAAIRAGYGELADAFLAQYPATALEESMLAITRDGMYGWTAERLVAKQTALGVPAYLYIFDHGYPAADEMGLHAFHASELPYVFGTWKKTAPLWPKVPGNTADLKTVSGMMGYWSSFTRDGVPRAEDHPAWQPYANGEAYMYFADVPRAAHELLPGMYELHEEVVCRRRAKGDVSWNWNIGIISPPLPAKSTECP